MTWLHDVIAWLAGALVALAAAMGLGGDGGPLRGPGLRRGRVRLCRRAGRRPARDAGRGARRPGSTPALPLFQLDRSSEQPARDDAAARLARAEASLANLRKGKRPSEIDAIQAQLAQAKAMLELSETKLERRRPLDDAVSREDVEEASAEYERDKARVAELQAELETARLGARADEIQAAEAEVGAAQAQLAQAEWRLDELSQAAPQAGLVVDTLYRRGRMGGGRRAGGLDAAARAT